MYIIIINYFYMYLLNIKYNRIYRKIITIKKNNL